MNIDYKFLIGDIIIPIVIFIAGFFTGKISEKKASAKISGSNNSVIQNSNIGSCRKD